MAKISKQKLVWIVTVVLVVIIAGTGVLMLLMNTRPKLQLGNVYRGSDINKVICYTDDTEQYDLDLLTEEAVLQRLKKTAVLVTAMQLTEEDRGEAEVCIYPTGLLTDRPTRCKLEIVRNDGLWQLVPNEAWYDCVTGKNQ